MTRESMTRMFDEPWSALTLVRLERNLPRPTPREIPALARTRSAGVPRHVPRGSRLRASERVTSVTRSPALCHDRDDPLAWPPGPHASVAPLARVITLAPRKVEANFEKCGGGHWGKKSVASVAHLLPFWSGVAFVRGRRRIG